MVLFDDIVYVERCSAATAAAKFSGLLQFDDRAVHSAGETIEFMLSPKAINVPEEYRSGEEQSPLLLCAQSLVSRLDLMVCKEPESADDDDDGRWVSQIRGPGGWMG